MTCGRLEENFANNELMASAFEAQGHGVVVHARSTTCTTTPAGATASIPP